MSTTTSAFVQPRQRGLSGLKIGALLLAAMQTPLGSTMISLALPAIAVEFGLTLSQATAFLVPSSFFVSVVFQSPGGTLADGLGRWRTFRLGLGVYGFGALLAVLAPDIAVLTIARCLMALGGAALTPATLALLRAHVAPSARSRVFGFYTASVGLASALGPVMGGLLVGPAGWRSIFVVCLVFLGAIFAAAGQAGSLRDTKAVRLSTWLRERCDWTGLAILSVALGLLLAASSLTGLAALAACAGGVAGLAVFLVWESRTARAVIDPRLFGSRGFSAGCAVIFLQSVAIYGVLFELPLFFAQFRGAALRETGVLLFVMMAGLFAASMASGALSTRWGLRHVSVAGALLTAAGCAWLTRLDGFAGPTAAIGAALLVGLGIGLCWGPAQTVVMGTVPAERSGMAAGTSSTLRYLGGGVGTLMLGPLLSGSDPASMAPHVAVMGLFATAAALSVIPCWLFPTAISRP